MPPLQLRPGVAAAGAARHGNPIGGRNTCCVPGSWRSCRTALVAVAAAKRGGKTAAATAAEVVREFYNGVNRRDLAAVAPLIAEGCVYEDLVFPRPFVGREQIIGFFGEFMGTISPDLQFMIDDISAEDSAAVGVTWHLGTSSSTASHLTVDTVVVAC
jgi:ketosteroid isomerase-like protein